MTKDKETKLAKRIKALFAKARSTMHEAEARAFEEKANELMAKHMIDAAALGAVGDTEKFIGVLYRVGNTGPRGRRMSNLMCNIARGHGVHPLVYSSRYTTRIPAKWKLHRYEDGEATKTVVSKGMYALLYGRAEVIDGVIAMFERLSVVMLAEASNLKGWDGPHTKRLRNNFLDGFGDAVGKRLKELNRKRDDESDGRFLPVLASDAARARGIAPKGRSSSGYASFGSGYDDGVAAGSRANLANRSMPNARRAIGVGS